MHQRFLNYKNSKTAVSRLLAEVKIFKNSNTKTYSKVFKSKEYIVNLTVQYYDRFGLKMIDEEKNY